MTKNDFQKLTQGVLLLDGATGSNLMAAGMPRGICTEKWVLEHKEVLQDLQRAYIKAGSRIIYAPTFGGNRYALGLHGLEGQLEELNKALVSVSREVADEANAALDECHATEAANISENRNSLTQESNHAEKCSHAASNCMKSSADTNITKYTNCKHDVSDETTKLMSAHKKVYVAGDITTTGKMMSPAGDLTYEDAFNAYCEQIKVLAEAGVDLIVAETMINIEETLAALDAAASVCSLPVMCTMTVEADGSIFSGGNAIEAAAALEAAGAAAVGLNCSVGPDQLVSVIRNIKETVSIPVIAKPNAGMPIIDDNGQAHYNMTPAAFARHMKVLVESGATIIGGCCGTTPEYISETRKILGIFVHTPT